MTRDPVSSRITVPDRGIISSGPTTEGTPTNLLLTVTEEITVQNPGRTDCGRDLI